MDLRGTAAARTYTAPTASGRTEEATDESPRTGDCPRRGGPAPELRGERRGEAAARPPVLRSAPQPGGAERARPPLPREHVDSCPSSEMASLHDHALEAQRLQHLCRATCFAHVLEPANTQQ